MTDPIADIISRLKTAAVARKTGVFFPLSKKTLSVAQVLERTGYIEIVAKKGKKIHKQIEAKLIYLGEAPRFKGASRISTVSKRVYQKIKNVAPVKSGFGSLIMSTSKGVLSEKEAGDKGVGGEALFKIW